MIDKIINSGLVPPQELTIAITSACNLKCLHCWPRCGDNNRISNLSFEVFARLIGNFSRYGVERVIITGGEPILHPEWKKILSYTCKHSGIKDICLQTNATLINCDVINALREYSDILSVHVSLDGIAEHNDFVRGPNSYSKALTGLFHLSKSELKSRVHVNVTEFEHNYGDIPVLLEFVKSLGFARFTSSTMIRAGRAMDSPALKMPSDSQFTQIVQTYNTNSQFRRTYDKIGMISAIEWYKGKKSSTRCGCEIFKKPYVAADLRLFPCVFLQVDDFAAIVSSADGLDELILKYLPLWALLQKISMARTQQLYECRECSGFGHCAAGCMGRAMSINGNPFTKEDRCSLRKAIYKCNFQS